MAESESDEEVDVLSNNDQNGFPMYRTQNSTIHSQTSPSLGHTGGWKQGKGNAGLNSRYMERIKGRS